MTNKTRPFTKDEDEALAQWAEAGDFDPNFVGGKALFGAEAATATRTLLEAPGVGSRGPSGSPSTSTPRF